MIESQTNTQGTYVVMDRWTVVRVNKVLEAEALVLSKRANEPNLALGKLPLNG